MREIIGDPIADELKSTALRLARLSESYQRLFIGYFVSHLPESRKKRLLDAFLFAMYPEKRWHKIESWMERRFIRDMSITPRKMASICMGTMRINTVMAPKFISLARKVKNRLSMKHERRTKKLLEEKHNRRE
jgi:hypothetical protein